MRSFAQSDKTSQYPTVVVHQGMVIALVADNKEISYRVLDVKPSISNDDDGWTGSRTLKFPEELRPAGISLVTTGVTQSEIAADAPFRALSDGKYIYIFRQSVEGTLLADRFIYDRVTQELKANVEPRYQRSRKKDIPDSRKDTIDYQSIERDVFYEPTLELQLSGAIKGGCFTVLILPSNIPGQSRWLIFAENAATSRFDSYSIRKGADGLFDLGDVLECNFELKSMDGQLLLPHGAGLDAVLYAQQERVTDNFERKAKIKRAQRVMLAATTQHPTGGDQLAVLDYALGRDGSLVRVPDESTLVIPEIDLAQDQVTLPVILEDYRGLDLKAAILKPVSTKVAPYLFDSADGLVHLYFCGLPAPGESKGQFYVAQFDTTVARPAIILPILPEEKGSAVLRAVRPGSQMNGASLSIAPWKDKEHCRVSLQTSDGTIETWDEMPRRLDKFMAVMNGATASDPKDPRIDKGELLFYETELHRRYTSPREAFVAYDIPSGIGALRAESWQPLVQDQPSPVIEIKSGRRAELCKLTLNLMVDGVLVTETWTDVPRQVELMLMVLSGQVTEDAQDPEVKVGQKIVYKPGAKPTSTDPLADLTAGSNLFRFENHGASGKIIDQKVAMRRFETRGSLLFFVESKISADDAMLVSVNNVTNQPVTDQGVDAQWIPEPLGNALNISSGGYVQLEQDILPRRKYQGDLTLEAWVKPGPGKGFKQIVTSNLDAKTRFFLGLKPVLDSSDQNLEYYLPFAGSQSSVIEPEGKASHGIKTGEWNHVAAVYNTSNALNLDGQGSVDCGNNDALRLVPAITVEAWVGSSITGRKQVIASKWGREAKNQSWELFIDMDNKAGFSVRERTGGKLFTVKSSSVFVDGKQHHVAGVFDSNSREETAIQFDGVDDYVSIPATGLKGAKAPHTVEAWIWMDKYPTARGWILNLGKTAGAGNHHWLIHPDGSTQLGVWEGAQQNPVLPLQEWFHLAMIYDGKGLTCYLNGIQNGSSLDATFDLGEGKLVLGALVEAGGYVKDEINTLWAGKMNNLRVWDRALSEAEVRASMIKPANEVSGAAGHWAFDQVDKLVGKVNDRAGNNTGVIVGNPEFVEIDKGLYRQQIFVDGNVEDWQWLYYPPDSDWSLKTDIPFDSKTSIDFKIRGSKPELKIGDVLIIGSEQFGIKEISFGGATGESIVVDRQFNNSMKTTHNKNDEILLTRNPNAWLTSSDMDSLFQIAEITDTADTNVRIGATAADTDYFTGTIDEVRIWNLGRTAWQIAQFKDGALPRDEKGLAARWSFDEGRGRVAYDATNTSHGKLLHPTGTMLEKNELWAPSDRDVSWSLFLNGDKVAGTDRTRKLYVDEKVDLYGDADHFLLGAALKSDRPVSNYAGFLDEVRIWNQARKPEQIRDNMYRLLYGGEQRLIAYWTFDEDIGSTALNDHSGNAQSGRISAGASIQPSTAPIGNESPLIKHIYKGLDRRFNAKINATPSAAEYGDLQTDAEGNLFGVLKRFYFCPLDSGPAMLTGFKIGELEMNFISQVQTAPTLIGYIEGAPPVPSENLTVNDPDSDDYVGTSAITLTESSENIQIYSASRDEGFDMSVGFKIGAAINARVDAGIAVENEIIRAEAILAAQGKFEYSNSYLSSAQVSATSSRSLSNRLQLRGSWEEKQVHDRSGASRFLNPQVGQRYIPNNMGYALVKSATADLFALRLKHDGTLVAYQVLPNPEIPEDWNIIMFPINPKYVKNGTLDGMVGLVADQDYPNASDGERGSFFKPLEAYALKARIDREAKKQEGFYNRFDAYGETGGGVGADDYLSKDLEKPRTELGYDWTSTARQNKRSLVNTYVWTAAGGLFAEEQQFSTIREESKGGAYQFLGMGGLYAEYRMAVGGVGFYGELDVLLGTHINTTMTQAWQESAAFGLSIDLEGEGFINRWVGDPGRSSGYYLPEFCPGKVDAYRFMSFYLAPEVSNFNDFFSKVVDQNWLYERGPYSGQYLPNARALRQAASNLNQVWRVLHRVTYVSRVPPKLEERAVETRPKEVRRPDGLVGNVLLVEQIEEIYEHLYPGEQAALADLVKLGASIDVWLDAVAPWVWGKSLTVAPGTWKDPERRKELRLDVLSYLKGYYELSREDLERGRQPNISKTIQKPADYPKYFITSPLPWAKVNGKLTIRGTALLEKGVNKYFLEYLGSGDTAWKQIGVVKDGGLSGALLGSLQTSKLSPGIYRIRLRPDDGKLSPFVVPISVKK